MIDHSVARARVSDHAIEANARLLSDQDAGFFADVSYNGYGHGVVRAAKAAILGGAAGLVVAHTAEYELLRASGITHPLSIEAASPSSYSALQLYGLTMDDDFTPAMRVSAVVLGTKTVERGDGVSYGYTYRATRHTNLAMIGIGYADGLDRSASNRSTVLLDGALRPIAGRVAMNVLMLDLGDDTAELGTEAVVFGPERRAADWAAEIGRTVAEVAVEFGSKLGVNP